ncbi:PREDICTED: uncharacterized protein LOC106817629 isoform X2 [Priapulus caudatus]|uniref:Uncharacterized protein LOC106817629 isoform X2 n=1 Tax=Priapulus caudatus TaxID=37621 RepID=A0ABM1F026_PRICU|nr:PREDICTED: uncharacterized protein LOC106817629 isoform X2 [Priapulus caudatus]
MSVITCDWQVVTSGASSGISLRFLSLHFPQSNASDSCQSGFIMYGETTSQGVKSVKGEVCGSVKPSTFFSKETSVWIKVVALNPESHFAIHYTIMPNKGVNHILIVGSLVGATAAVSIFAGVTYFLWCLVRRRKQAKVGIAQTEQAIWFANSVRQRNDYQGRATFAMECSGSSGCSGSASGHLYETIPECETPVKVQLAQVASSSRRSQPPHGATPNCKNTGSPHLQGGFVDENNNQAQETPDSSRVFRPQLASYLSLKKWASLVNMSTGSSITSITDSIQSWVSLHGNDGFPGNQELSSLNPIFTDSSITSSEKVKSLLSWLDFQKCRRAKSTDASRTSSLDCLTVPKLNVRRTSRTSTKDAAATKEGTPTKKDGEQSTAAAMQACVTPDPSWMPPSVSPLALFSFPDMNTARAPSESDSVFLLVPPLCSSLSDLALFPRAITSVSQRKPQPKNHSGVQHFAAVRRARHRNHFGAPRENGFASVGRKRCRSSGESRGKARKLVMSADGSRRRPQRHGAHSSLLRRGVHNAWRQRVHSACGGRPCVYVLSPTLNASKRVFMPCTAPPLKGRPARLAFTDNRELTPPHRFSFAEASIASGILPSGDKRHETTYNVNSYPFYRAGSVSAKFASSTPLSMAH